MKITLINPRTASFGERRLSSVPLDIRKKFFDTPSGQKKIELTRKAFGALGALTVAGAIPGNIEVEYFDENMEEVDLERDFDLVGLTGNLDQLNRSLAICDLMRKRQIPVVAGGPAAITFPELYNRKGVSVVVGEGELLFAKFLEDFRRNDTRKIYNQNTVAFLDMEKAPFPRFDLAAKYPYTFVGMQISRGCPYNCNYCQVTRIFGNKSRCKTIDHVVKEIEIVKSYWPDSFFFFYSDNPFIDRKYTIALFDEIYKRKNIDMGRWGAMANVTLYKDKELMQAITAGGPVAYMGIGFESLSERTLKSIDNKMKVNYLQQYEEAIRVLRENRINPVGYFMFGFEDSGAADLRDIIEFVKRNKIYIELNHLTPMPKTALYDRLKNEYEKLHGKIRKPGLSEWGVINKYLQSKSGLSEQDIHEALVEFYTNFLEDQSCVDADVPFCTLL